MSRGNEALGRPRPAIEKARRVGEPCSSGGPPGGVYLWVWVWKPSFELREFRAGVETTHNRCHGEPRYA
ncbi:hypothetical protein ENSA5_16280 [Enhygromyxa salina]|uniref:Uncharacterized protein n=1 Tax=Enhygromyxa salina TaxID=215803 RepID=A0A2S9YEG1_9BACT|nr:hypothetical protein ENSA5_16280 [Enhygromyxa salina]